jgi:hypothetical protein
LEELLRADYEQIREGIPKFFPNHNEYLLSLSEDELKSTLYRLIGIFNSRRVPEEGDEVTEDYPPTEIMKHIAN